MMLKLPVEETKKVDLRHGHHVDTFKTRRQSAKGVTFGNEHTSIRINGE